MSSPAPDYFALFGVERRFDIDVAAVESRYRELSKQAHPDRFVGAAASQRVAAMQETMSLNAAVKTLVDPVRRAEYLLELHGVRIADNERIDPTLITSILEAREELADAMAAGDEPRLAELEEAMLDRRDELLERVSALFAQLPARPTPEQLAEIKAQLILLRYVSRYLEQLDAGDRDGQAA